MTDFTKDIIAVNLEDEMRQSYLEYAMSVIVGRALPDVRDGLKPVHRRILFAMHNAGHAHNKAHKKSAEIVGDVMGKYHPHGDFAIYATAVRMAQPFSLRYPLIDGQGNFGSIDGDAAAAMRYTEMRMNKITHALLADIDKDTVNFTPNYSNEHMEPVVLPTRVPNLLINGTSGIAVGMATNVPPHNLTEIINACVALLNAPEMSITDLMQHVKGPDFPTAAWIYGTRGIYDAYHTGRGRVVQRARCEIETNEKDNRQTIIINELPYQVNKARLIQRIAELHKEKQIEGIAPDGLRDESDKDGLRVVIELKRGESAEVILNQLYRYTPLESVFNVNMVVLIDGQPRLLNLKEVLEAFLRHRREVVTRRTIFEVNKAQERAHILEGLTVALANIDPVIALIKASPSAAIAKQALQDQAWLPGQVEAMLERAAALSEAALNASREHPMRDGKYYLSETQAQAILDMRLHRLTGLEQDKIFEEYKALLDNIESLVEILVNPERLKSVIQTELEDIRQQFGDERRTEINPFAENISMEDLIAKEDVVVTLSRKGYAKYQKVTDYQAQKRGGRGKIAAKVKDEDDVEHLITTHTHSQLMCFASSGKVYWLKVYELPEAGRQASGRPIINLLPLSDNERITSILPIENYDENRFIFMATRQGVVKKTSLDKFASQRSNGLIALTLDEGDELIGTIVTDGEQDIMLFSSNGKVNRFSETDIRPTGRGSRGVRGMTLEPEHTVISMMLAQAGGTILTATVNGYGKRSRIDEFTRHNRGGKGMIGIQTSERNGAVIGACLIDDSQEVLLISANGVMVRTRATEISVLGRNTQGVRLIRLDNEDKLVGISTLASSDDENEIDEMNADIQETNID